MNPMKSTSSRLLTVLASLATVFLLANLAVGPRFSGVAEAAEPCQQRHQRRANGRLRESKPPLPDFASPRSTILLKNHS